MSGIEVMVLLPNRSRCSRPLGNLCGRGRTRLELAFVAVEDLLLRGQESVQDLRDHSA